MADMDISSVGPDRATGMCRNLAQSIVDEWDRNGTTGKVNISPDTAIQLAETFLALDKWIVAGGPRPRRWRGGGNWPPDPT